MGVYLHFQAMPEGSRLARLLRTERPLHAMYCEVIHHPAGPYDTARLSPDELDEMLADIAGRVPVFGSRPVVDKVNDDLQTELERAAREYPGLPEREAYFKLRDFARQLARSLSAAGQPDAECLAKKLVWGAERFGPDDWTGANVTLLHVPPSLVREAAAVLPGVSPSVFEYAEDDWAAFRAAYLAAAERGEGIIIA